VAYPCGIEVVTVIVPVAPFKIEEFEMVAEQDVSSYCPRKMIILSKACIGSMTMFAVTNLPVG
jgi:hypothetical protein